MKTSLALSIIIVEDLFSLSWTKYLQWLANVAKGRQEAMISIDREPTKYRKAIKTLYRKLGIIPTKSGFQCSYHGQCFSNVRWGRKKFYTGSWAYVGVDYGKAWICGKRKRILIVGIDRGGHGEYSGERFEKAQESFRCACENWQEANPHMRGVSLILRELVDNKEPATYATQFAFTNSLKCARKTGKMETKRSSRMRSNCRHHLIQEVQLLKPHILIAQGNDARWMVKDAFEPEGTPYQAKVRGIRGFSEIYVCKGIIVALTPHPTRLKGMEKSGGILSQVLKRTVEKILGLCGKEIISVP